MQTERGVVELERLHTPRSSPLRAWSAADVLAIDHVASLGELGRVLIVNDEFGALTCALASEDLTVWTDSALSRSAIGHNLRANGTQHLTSQHVRGHEQPSGPFDTVVVRIPKTTELLRHQLAIIRQVSHPSTTVVGTGMVRHIHTSTVDAFEELIGPTHTSRAARKARLIHAEPTAAPRRLAEPTTFTTASGLHVVQRPGTFSSGHLDVGSALLIETLSQQPAPAAGSVVADLGCGNGVLAAEMALLWPQASFVLLDTSDLAVDAALATWQHNGLASSVRADAADGFSTTPDASIDVVITNPPFHQGHALDPGLTDRLLADTARVLTPGGVAYIVAQRHLQMHTRLLQWFTNVEVLSKHPTHVAFQVS